MEVAEALARAVAREGCGAVGGCAAGSPVAGALAATAEGCGFARAGAWVPLAAPAAVEAAVDGAVLAASEAQGATGGGLVAGGGAGLAVGAAVGAGAAAIA